MERRARFSVGEVRHQAQGPELKVGETVELTLGPRCSSIEIKSSQVYRITLYQIYEEGANFEFRWAFNCKVCIPRI